MTVAHLFDRLLTLTLPPLPSTSRLYLPTLIIGIIALGLVIVWLPPIATALLLGGTLFLLFLLRKPVLALYLLIPIIPFSSLLSLSLGGVRAGLMEIILILGLTAWLLRLLVEKSCIEEPPKPQTPASAAYLLWPLILFLGSVSLSWLNTLSIGASLVETIKWVEVLALYLFATNLLTRRNLKWFVTIILLTGVAQAVLGLYQFIFKVGPEGFLLFGGRFLRAFGTFAQPNPYAGYLGLILPLALALAVWAFFELKFSDLGNALRRLIISRFWSKLSHPDHGLRLPKKLKIENIQRRLLTFILLSLTLGLLLAALFASQSRGAWLAFAIAATVTLIAGSNRPGLLLATLLAAGTVVGLVGAFDWNPRRLGSEPSESALDAVTQRFVDAATIATITDIGTLEVTDANFATVERLAHWQAAREMWRDHPWLGVGFGNYAVIYPAYAIGRWLDPLGHAHNYLLNIGAETGLVGVIGYLIFWIFTFGVTWAAIRRSDGFLRAVAAGSFGTLVHLHVHNLFDNLYVQGMYLHIAIVLAIISIIYSCSQSPKQRLPRRFFSARNNF